MARPAPLIDLTDEQRTVLEGLARRRETAHRLVRRARIVRRRRRRTQPGDGARPGP